MFKFLKSCLISISLISLAGCGSAHDQHTLRVGTISGPETELMQTAKNVAKKWFGLEIQLIEFTDYTKPNIALSEGSIDANIFQHQPYLNQQIQNFHYDFVAIGKTFLYPMGIYSNKIKNIHDIRDGAIVAIPNDPSNEGRALLLLQQTKLIRLQNSQNIYATPRDIAENPKKLQFKELDAAELPRALPDVDIAIINTNYAIPAGLSPTKMAIFLEDKSSPYANLIVIRKDEMNDPRMKQLVAAVNSEAVLKESKKIFHGEAIPAWNHQKEL